LPSSSSAFGENPELESRFSPAEPEQEEEKRKQNFASGESVSKSQADPPTKQAENLKCNVDNEQLR
jgi:hypothetical protein